MMTYGQWKELPWREMVTILRPTLTGYHATMAKLYLDGPEPHVPYREREALHRYAEQWALGLSLGSRTYESLVQKGAMP